MKRGALVFCAPQSKRRLSYRLRRVDVVRFAACFLAAGFLAGAGRLVGDVFFLADFLAVNLLAALAVDSGIVAIAAEVLDDSGIALIAGAGAATIGTCPITLLARGNRAINCFGRPETIRNTNKNVIVLSSGSDDTPWANDAGKMPKPIFEKKAVTRSVPEPVTPPNT